MKHKWPLTPLGEVLTARRETPSDDDLASGRVGIIEKISFDTGHIHLRSDGSTRTGMILVRPGDLVVSGINAAKGAIAIYDPDAKDPVAATIHYGAYSPHPDRADVRFLWWMLRSQFFRTLLNDHVPGGIKTELKATRLLLVPVPLPSLPEQRRIVARIEKLAAQIDEARILREQGMAETGALRFASLLEIISDCTAEEIALESVCLDIIDNLHSNPRYEEFGVPCIRSPDVGWGILHLDRALQTDENEYRRRTTRGKPQADDIVFVREGGGTGKCALVLPGQRFSLGQRVMMLRPNKRLVEPRFFLYQLLSPLVQEEQIAPLSKGSASPHLNIGALRHFRLRLPTLPEQRRIVAELEALQVEVDALKKLQAETTTELDALLPAILDRAFKGDL